MKPYGLWLKGAENEGNCLMANEDAEQVQEHTDQSFELFAQMSSLPIPQLTFNSTVNNVTASEISSILSFGSRPLAILIMSPVMAKTFGESLLALVEMYESNIGQPVLSINQINERRSIKAGGDV